jgi:hypothetical protein
LPSSIAKAASVMHEIEPGAAAYYRAFLIDKTDRIFAFRTLNCVGDAAALRLAAIIQQPCTLIEVWDRARLVGRVQPKTNQPQS